MSLPEGYLPRKGDVVILHATVRYDFDPGVSDNVSLSIREHDSNFVPLDKIVGLYARRWDVGDKVRVRSNGQFGEVAAVNGEHVWVKHPAETARGGPWFKTIHANELDHDQPPPVADEEIPPVPAAVEALADDGQITEAPQPPEPDEQENPF